jgi:hypothetical protein
MVSVIASSFPEPGYGQTKPGQESRKTWHTKTNGTEGQLVDIRRIYGPEKARVKKTWC